MIKKVEISHKTIFFILVVLFLFWSAYLIRDIILLFYVGVLLMLALGPGVNKLEKLRVPRILAVLLNYLAFFGFLVLAIFLLAGPLSQQGGLLLQQIVKLAETAGAGDWLSTMIQDPFKNILPLSGNIFRITQTIFGNLVQVFSVLVVSFYLILDRKKLPSRLEQFFGKKRTRKVEIIIRRAEREVGRWLWGELLLMLIVALLTYLVLLLLRFPYALPLAFLAGLLEVLPNIGPVLAAIPAIVIGFTINPLMAVLAALVFLVIQQLENSLITPKIMQGATGINPIITLLGLLVGFRLAGAVGAIFALPTILIIKVVIEETVLPRITRMD
ncbi:MAG: AI-2E family transporter [Candidatus Shapirobacteria bacterium]|nr:AI-2E family transporter [Candidatus Shapirobacteria bacterium]MDD5073978.1 AI-2E family transporter [Candidatus Shapirobacteria bacterium]MDD5481601.1 AI-2E family transporter [Candidatus Shapirobacteria bacterium]